MIQLDNHAFITFDLDDTLYKENDYHDSGLKAVSDFMGELYGVEAFEKLCKWKKEANKDLWGMLCQELNLPLTVKEALIWLYRLHFPALHLSNSTRSVIEKLDTQTQGIAILTDGRSVTQRLKLLALGLSGYPAYISEEWESEKPYTKRFVEIMAQHPAKKYVYVGENPKKDFKGPNELGWVTIGLEGDDQNIHSQNTEKLPEEYLPNIWINNLEQLCGFLC